MFLYKLIFLFHILAGLTLCGRIKRNDIDLQTCISNFDIHKDKIIRTQDSRDMGAKYLNEIDLGSREECLRLCCETEDCDVFVFEEKNSGSCYLFHCGPPEDFKCKFTHHVNYSSAVLAINRHLPDLESQIKLTKHEQDLTKLRKPDMEAEVNIELVGGRTTPATSTTTSTERPSKEMVAIEKVKPPTEEETRKCSRNQFECRSTGECIAIYNACDGIPQCADGSDEAPELGCPEAQTTSPPIVLSHQTRNLSPQNAISNQNNPPPRLHISNISPPQDLYHIPSASQQNSATGQSRQQQQQQEDFIRPMMEPRNPVPSHSIVGYEPQQVAQYVPLPPQTDTGGWIPHQSNQMPPQMSSQYVDKNSHIFNHKETGLQVPEGQETRYNKYKGAMQVLHRTLGYANAAAGPMQYSELREYPKVPAYYSDVYRPQIPPPRENWGGISDESSYLANNAGYNPNIRTLPETTNVEHQQLPREPNIKQQNYKELPVVNYKSEKGNPPHIQEKMAQDLKHSKEHMENAESETKKPKSEKHAGIHHEKPEHYPAVAAYKMVDNYEPQDGVAETPSGAILSLTLGLIITCVMAVLIGCRLRVVRRRMRKCGKSYAHDADYLVNGMYL